MVVRQVEFGDDNHTSRAQRAPGHYAGHYHRTDSRSRQASNPNRTTMFHGEVTTIKELPLGIRFHGSPEMHEAGLTGRGIRVGVIDSGCDMNHPLFKGQLINERVYKQEKDGKLDDEPHGTHVAGTVNMMAPEAEIIGYRVFGAESVQGGELGLSGNLTVNEAICMAISQAEKDGCNIINMSLGTAAPDIPIANRVKEASRKGIIFVVAAGNEGDDDPMTVELSYPAPQKETISIASFAKKNGLPVAFFSNTNPQNNYIACGWDITSYKAGSDGYCRLSGTSMAAPHATGLIAALLTKGMKHENCLSETDPENNDKRVRDMLRQYTIDVGTPGFDPGSGLGMITFLSLQEFNARFAGEGYSLPDLAHMDDPDSAPKVDEDDLADYQRHQRKLRRRYKSSGRYRGHRETGFHEEEDDDKPPPRYARHIKRQPKQSYSRYKGNGTSRYGYGKSSSSGGSRSRYQYSKSWA